MIIYPSNLIVIQFITLFHPLKTNTIKNEKTKVANITLSISSKLILYLFILNLRIYRRSLSSTFFILGTYRLSILN